MLREAVLHRLSVLKLSRCSIICVSCGFKSNCLIFFKKHKTDPADGGALQVALLNDEEAAAAAKGRGNISLHGQRKAWKYQIGFISKINQDLPRERVFDLMGLRVIVAPRRDVPLKEAEALAQQAHPSFYTPEVYTLLPNVPLVRQVDSFWSCLESLCVFRIAFWIKVSALGH